MQGHPPTLHYSACPAANTFACWTYRDGHPSVEKFWRPILAAFGQEVEHIPNRGKEIYAPAVWVAVGGGMKRSLGGIKMMDFAVRFAAEDADDRMLSLVTFDVEILVETTLAAR